MKVVYIAGPFRCTNAATRRTDMWGVHCNVIRAMEIALEVWRHGAVALCPHGNTAHFQDASGIADDNIWLDGDIELLRRCDAVLMVPGWQVSSGATAEKKYAEAQHIPVFESLEDLYIWIGVRK